MRKEYKSPEMEVVEMNNNDIITTSGFDNNNLIVFAVPHQCEVSSISIAKIGYAKYKNGEYGNSSILSPIYLRKSQAELSLKKENEEILNGN